MGGLLALPTKAVMVFPASEESGCDSSVIFGWSEQPVERMETNKPKSSKRKTRINLDFTFPLSDPGGSTVSRATVAPL